MDSSPNSENAPQEAAMAKEHKETKKTSKKKLVILLIILLLISLALYFLFRFFLASKPDNYGDQISVNEPVKTAETGQGGESATSTEAAKLAKAIASSENFDLLQINLEGSATNVYDFSENELFIISNVASELFFTKEGDKTEIKALISCQTNKRSYVDAEYIKSGEKAKKIIKDPYLSFNHVIVLPALDPDSVYKYSISATDLNGTTIYSEQFVFYTGVGSISLVDILGNAVQKVFGWAMGR